MGLGLYSWRDFIRSYLQVGEQVPLQSSDPGLGPPSSPFRGVRSTSFFPLWWCAGNLLISEFRTLPSSLSRSPFPLPSRFRRVRWLWQTGSGRRVRTVAKCPLVAWKPTRSTVVMAGGGGGREGCIRGLGEWLVRDPAVGGQAEVHSRGPLGPLEGCQE